MRFKQFYLNEMPMVVGGSEETWSKTSEAWEGYSNIFKSSKVLKKYDYEYFYRVVKDKQGHFNIFCLNPNENEFPKVIAIMQFSKDKVIKDYKFPQVKWVAVYPKFRNKNIGTELYITAIDYFGGIVSDTSLTKYSSGIGSQNIWKSLSKSKYVYAYDGKNFKSLDQYEIDSKEYNDENILFVASETPIKGAILENIDESDERKIGKLYSQIHPEISYVKIYRARNIQDSTFEKNDYITLSYKFAIEHAESNHVVEDEPQIVIRKLVPSKWIAEATNPGEYLFVGPKTNGEIVYKTLGPNDYDGEIPDIRNSKIIKL